MTSDIIDLIPSALRVNDPNPALETVTATTISFDSVTKEIQDSGNGLGGFVEGAFVFVSGSSDPTFNSGFYVTTVEAGRLVLDVADGLLGNIAAGDSITISQRTFRSGKKQNFISFQERETDLSAAGNLSYITQKDGLIGNMVLTCPTSGAVTCTITVVSSAQLNGNSAVSGQTDDPFVEKQPLSNLDMTWYPDQQVIPDDEFRFTDVTIDINSNITPVEAAGVEGALANPINTITVTGSLNSVSFVEDPRIEQRKQQDGVVFGMSYLFEFDDGKKMVVTKQRMRYTEGSRERSNDTTATFSGTYDAETGDTGSTIQIDFNY